MAEHVAVYCQRPLAWDWQKRVCGLPNYVKETVERVEPCRLSYGSFWREAAVQEFGISPLCQLPERNKESRKNRGFYRARARGSDKED